MLRIDPPKSERIARLVKDYACFPSEQLQESVLKISKRLGGKDTKDSLDALQESNYQKVADIALGYYDKFL